LTSLKSKMNEINFKKEEDFMRMMLILLSELKKMHSQNILHRDLKPENCMFFQKNDQLYFILIDFGASHLIGSEKKKVESVSTGFSPPEQNTSMECFGSNKKKFYFFFKYYFFFFKVIFLQWALLSNLL
jgi:serine/threonine protein kinase